MDTSFLENSTSFAGVIGALRDERAEVSSLLNTIQVDLARWDIARTCANMRGDTTALARYESAAYPLRERAESLRTILTALDEELGLVPHPVAVVEISEPNAIVEDVPISEIEEAAEEEVGEKIQSSEELWALIRRAGNEAATTPSRAVAQMPVGPSLAVRRCRLKKNVADAKAEGSSSRIEELRRQHIEVFGRNGYVFGFASDHTVEQSEWRQLSEAYDLLASALDLMDRTDRFTDAGRDAAIRARAASELLIRAMVPCGSNLYKDEDMDTAIAEADARGVRAFPQLEWMELRKYARGERKDVPNPHAEALELVEDVVGQYGSDGHDPRPEDLETAVLFALDAGVRHSDPRLREVVMGLVEEIERSSDRRVLSVAREARLEIDRLSRDDEEPEEASSDAEYDRIRESVRNAVRGKRLMIVGGVKRPDASQRIAEELGVEEVFWPETTYNTKTGFYIDRMGQYDIIVRLAAFARQGSRDVLDAAKAQGKESFQIRKGYHPKRFVLDYAEQVLHLSPQ